MSKPTLLKFFLMTLIFQLIIGGLYAQEIPIQNYSLNINGQVQLEINSNINNYYVLNVKHHPDSTFAISSSITLGQAGTTIITEPLKAYPIDHYQVLEYAINAPFDTDGDGVDDIMEYNNMPTQGALNAAIPITLMNGLVSLNTFSAFQSVAITENLTPWLTYLDDKEFLKFIILDFDSPNPKVYFINSNTHVLHADFANIYGIDYLSPTLKKGHLIFHSTVISANGTLGTYAFNYSNNDNQEFKVVQRTQELLAANMPYLKNNLSYFVTENNEDDYQDDILLYQNSRVPALFESDVFAGVNYWGMHQAEGYGLLRVMNIGESPGAKDIVIYESLPNTLPRVGGIITAFVQTPLSHVNLRAIQDNVPNAFIRDPLTIDTIANLVGHYVYFKVNQSNYEIREATLEEVNNWYDLSRPATEQIPPLNLDYRSIFPLDKITFDMYDGFGAKAANMATMRTFGFPEGTIPNGYAVPFFFYQEFMKHNKFFEEIELFTRDAEFMSNREYREEKLEEFREKIEEGKMPNWMLQELYKMQQSFPLGTSIRCRSSTNNEDLPGFSGAGLYDSKTQHPDEGHISKSIKEVYASLWNLRAFEERDFYRINHFYTSMGVLCHPNFSDEKVNGVGVSSDPIYHTSNNFYLNSQLGEDLITNPGSNSVPEELLLRRIPDLESDYTIVQYSSFVNGNSLLMTPEQLNLMREYLSVIHDKFAILYHAEKDNSFAMDIEYKITSENQLVIKQARPWVAFSPQKMDKISENCEFLLFPNPASDFINVRCEDCEEARIKITDISGKVVFEKQVNQTGSANTHILIDHLPIGLYFINGYFGDSMCGSVKFVKQ